MKRSLSRAMIAAAAALIVTGLSTQPSQSGAVTTSLFLPLQGDVVFPTTACGAGEPVSLGGMVHVVSILLPMPPPISQSPVPPPIRLHFNMAGVLGTGETSGNTFVMTGAQDFSGPTPPPITPQGFALQPNPPPIFQLEGTDACAGKAQLPVNFNLIFDSSGHLLPSSSAGFGQCTTDLGCTGG
jgi:hypothetical protein